VSPHFKRYGELFDRGENSSLIGQYITLLIHTRLMQAIFWTSQRPPDVTQSSIQCRGILTWHDFQITELFTWASDMAVLITKISWHECDWPLSTGPHQCQTLVGPSVRVYSTCNCLQCSISTIVTCATFIGVVSLYIIGQLWRGLLANPGSANHTGSANRPGCTPRLKV